MSVSSPVDQPAAQRQLTELERSIGFSMGVLHRPRRPSCVFLARRGQRCATMSEPVDHVFPLNQLHQDASPPPGEKLAVARLQREVTRTKSEGTMREKLVLELEEERRLRLDSEKRLHKATEEAELGRTQMVTLQQHFSRMEETVRSLLQNPAVVEQTSLDTVDIMTAYKDKLSEEVHKPQDGSNQLGSLPLTRPETEPRRPPPSGDPDSQQAEEEKDKTTPLLERLKALEEENSALALENENQREQYERCLDEVANQVVQALLTQKDLREECLKLRTRVFDLELQNQTLSVLFQQRIKPASDLLLQKLQSRILDLSAADLLLEPERAKSILLSRNPESGEVQLNGKVGLPVAKCLSQLSLMAPPVYPRSSCSSSELSLSSACSEFSSGSYTWNDRRSCGKMSSLTWEKRLSLGSSAPSNICTPLEEQLPTRRKESHILEGLRKLQRRKHRSSSFSSKVSKSGYKDCMNSNEGIYSLGIKSCRKGISKPPYVGRVAALSVGVKKFSYDSDDADDESAHSNSRDVIASRDGWFYSKKLSHSVSDSLCSWEGLQDSGVGGDGNAGLPGYNSKERPEKLMSFINSLLPEGRQSSTFTKPSLPCFKPSEPEYPLHLSDTDDLEELNSESSDIRTSISNAEQVEPNPKRLSRDIGKLLAHQCLRKDQGRAQSADGRPRPFSLIKEVKAVKCTQSEESILAIFDAEGEPIELCAQRVSAGAGIFTDISASKTVTNYTELAPQERPTRQKAGKVKNSTVLEYPEKPSEYLSKTNKTDNNRERLSVHGTPQKKLIKPPSSQANKGHSGPHMNDASSSTFSGSRIPGRGKPAASPLRVSKGSTTEPSNSGNPAPPTQEKIPSSPPVKMSKYIKAQGGTCAQSPKAVTSKLLSRGDWSKSAALSSPSLSRQNLEYADSCEQPTRDKHCETSKNQLRSPSPPLPPGRTTSLLIRPNYEGSPQAHKLGVAQPSTPTTVRGPPPSYHPPPVPNMQTTPPVKGQDPLDLDAGYGTALAPQKLVEKTSQHLQKSPAKGISKRTSMKHYLLSATSGCAPEPQHAPKSSKNVPPPYGALRGSSLQSTFASKRGSTHEHVNQSMQKTSSNLAASLQDQSQCKAELKDSKIANPQAVVVSPLCSAPNQMEKASKTRIPMGFKAFLKSPPSHKNSPTMPGKQEKDHINSVSKETVTSNVSTQCDSLQPVHNIDLPVTMNITEEKGEGQGRLLEGVVHTAEQPEGGEACEKGKRGSQLFLRSISVTNKPHLKPALGMNGAKARSQSFSTNYMEKPNINLPDGLGKIRTQIITNSGERGSSLSRQSSLEVPRVGLVESPVHCPIKRLSHYGGLMGSNGHNVLPDRTSQSGSKGDGSQSTIKGEGVSPQPQKEVRSLPITDRIGLRNNRRPVKVASHPQFQPPSTHFYSYENATQETRGKLTSHMKPDPGRVVLTQTDPPKKTSDIEEKKVSPTACTIEEKVMMGIEENVQKCHEQDKVTASEGKQKTGPSLANWFGLRKSKLPALSGKKTDSPKGKEEKKELKIGSVLGGKQLKKKDKKKNDNQCKDSQEEQNRSETNNKLSSIMDHCNIQMGQIANQIQCTTAYIGKDHFVKELLSRAAVKGDALPASPPAISIPRKHCHVTADMEICTDTATVIMSQKINLKAENEEGHVPDTSCQDHVIGSGCQTRTLDSGIGTFPLPDSVMRAGGRHMPKSESSPDHFTSGLAEFDQNPPSSPPNLSSSQTKVPSPSKTRLHAPPAALGPSLSQPAVTCSTTQSPLPKPTSSEALRTNRRSFAVSDETPDREEEAERGMNAKDLHHPPAKEFPVEPGSLHLSLESLNKLNLCSSTSDGLYPETGAGGRHTCSGGGCRDSCRRPDEAASSCVSREPGPNAVGSLSDSMYDSFSSCTSQGSSEL
ncbi:nck-associated protein 5-like [Lampris incognitus]|uniref:nck-associated protein 5-like n=1 Tax=Lampris incognitus TaxID=2546036 RepID=UPI0024B538A9|nr:nck-associated protein 5-like [Lampris incognitus]